MTAPIAEGGERHDPQRGKQYGTTYNQDGTVHKEDGDPASVDIDPGEDEKKEDQ